jgi:hypothetical protein
MELVLLDYEQVSVLQIEFAPVETAVWHQIKNCYLLNCTVLPVLADSLAESKILTTRMLFSIE